MSIAYHLDREWKELSILLSIICITLPQTVRKPARDFFLSTFNLLHRFAYTARIDCKIAGFYLPIM